MRIQRKGDHDIRSLVFPSFVNFVFHSDNLQ